MSKKANKSVNGNSVKQIIKNMIEVEKQYGLSGFTESILGGSAEDLKQLNHEQLMSHLLNKIKNK